MTVTDPIGGIVSQSITVPTPGNVQGPTAGTASILISDTSHGTAGLVLDDQTPSVLTTTGTIPFTDSGTHTVKAVALAGDWGTLTPVVSTDTTNSSLGEVSWTYQINEALAATLAAGATHQDTFAVQLTGSGGTATEDVTVTVVGTKESPNVAWGFTPAGATISVDTSQGFTVGQGTLAGLASELLNSVQTLNTTKFVNTNAGHTFQLIGTGFTYDSNGHLIGGSVSEVDVLDVSNNKLLSETGFNIDLSTTGFANAVNQIFNLVPNMEVGSTGPDTIFGSNAATDILIGGGGGDSLTAGSGKDILVSGPGGDGLPLTNHDITVTVTFDTGRWHRQIRNGERPCRHADCADHRSVFPRGYSVRCQSVADDFRYSGDDTDLGAYSGATLTPVNGRITFSQAQLANTQQSDNHCAAGRCREPYASSGWHHQ